MTDDEIRNLGSGALSVRIDDKGFAIGKSYEEDQRARRAFELVAKEYDRGREARSLDRVALRVLRERLEKELERRMP